MFFRETILISLDNSESGDGAVLIKILHRNASDDKIGLLLKEIRKSVEKPSSGVKKVKKGANAAETQAETKNIITF